MTSSSCHDTETKHDVFISFRGADVRRGLLSHLIKELRRAHIDAYVDDRLERGNEIPSSLLRAIEGSQILLVIFSKGYAFSKWCLEELVKMVECMETNEQIVMPIFYNVDPSYVRCQKGYYSAALARHEKKEDMVKVQNWRYTLKRVAQLSGFHYPSKFENESNLVDEIVKDVSNKLSKLCSSESDEPIESNGLIGIGQNIAWIKSLLITESREVLKFGIWGMGGIGKTTIARVIFDTHSCQYQGCCFLENIRDELKNHQLSCLREKLVSKLLEDENHHTNGIGIAHSTKSKLRRKKVLIVLDDVNTPELLKDFLEPICLGPGSRVIVTSRDKRVFITGGFYKIHKVKELNFEESLELFCINAFNESQPKMEYEELSKSAVAITKGNPLALKVFGSHFHSKSKDTWECALEKLKQYPEPNIQRVLRLSYDGLDDLEKKVFLDIAFFFKEEDKDYVIKQLDGWRFHGISGIEALQEKALITISNDNRIQMHDLIQEMGWEIVRQESKDPTRRSRLRDAKEVNDVLKNNKETDSVEGMLLDISQVEEAAINVDSLKRMPNIRLLKLYSPLPVQLSMQQRILVPEGTDVLDGREVLDTLVKMVHRLIELNWPMHAEHLMLRFAELQHVVNEKGSVLGIPNHLVMVQQLPMTVLPKLANSSACDGVRISETNNVSGSKQLMPLLNPSIASALTELMSFGSEVHIKCVNHLVMDSCSVSKDLEFSDIPEGSSVALEVMRQLNLRYTGMELLNSSTGILSSLECCSDIDGPQHETLPKELPSMRSTYYHRFSCCREQDSGKTKLLVLFDGLRYSGRISFSSLALGELSGELLNLLSSLQDFDQESFFRIMERFCNEVLAIVRALNFPSLE